MMNVNSRLIDLRILVLAGAMVLPLACAEGNTPGSELINNPLAKGYDDPDGGCGMAGDDAGDDVCTWDDAGDDEDGGKVVICHIPPGNPENAHTIEISWSAWPAHRDNHGDTLGPCEDDDDWDDDDDWNDDDDDWNDDDDDDDDGGDGHIDHPDDHPDDDGDC
jgi:hypothetical protein